ncbi:MAG: SRPBCC family protein [Bacteroidota bacterium]
MRFFLIIITLIMTQNQISAQLVDTKHSFHHTEITSLSPTSIWNAWTDVPTWPEWDSGLQSATLEGGWQIGAKGKITPDKGPKVKFEVVEFVKGQSYTLKMPLPLGSFYLHRFLTEKDGQTQFTHQIYFKGLTAGIFANSMGKRYQTLLPPVMQALIERQ